MHKTIYIIRHGETDLNKNGIVQGSGVDAGLNETGQKQAQAFYDYYKDQNFEVILSSKLIRTHQTIRPFVEDNIPWKQYEEINEIDWGKHEGKKSTPEMRQHYRELLLKWDQGKYDAKLEEGESALEMATRLQKFVDHLKTRTEKKILICSHGRAMRCLTCLLKGEAIKNMQQYQHSNTGLFLVEYDGEQFDVLLENDSRHLIELEKELTN